MAELLGTLFAEAARALAGCPFRPQGRGKEGLDCLGLVLAAGAAVGVFFDVPALAMVGHSRSDVLCWLRQLGFYEVGLGDAQPGDVLLSFPATRQAHLGIRTGSGLVEANARVRRVIESAWLDGAGWHSAWRLHWELV